jgi:hypothetical protein
MPPPCSLLAPPLQGVVSTTRTSQRSAKAKGKEPGIPQPVAISEDEFELVMGLFEKVTHEKVEFLHHVCRFLFLAVEDAKLRSSHRVLSWDPLSHRFWIIKRRSQAG